MLQNLKFKPAQYYPGKDARVEYYFLDGEKWTRKRIRVNHIVSLSERKKYAKALVESLNDKLYSGWLPIEGSPSESLQKAIRFFTGNFLPEREDSVRTYTSTISIFSQWAEMRGYLSKPCSLFSKKCALEFLGDMNVSKKLSARTYNNYLTLMRTVFNKLVEHQYCKENPFNDISKKRPKEKSRKVIPTHVLKSIKHWMSSNQPEMLLPIKLIFYCGLRPTELCRLKVENVLFDRNLIYIESDQAKDHEAAPISLPSHIVEDLATHVGNSKMSHYLFSGDNLKPGNKRYNARGLAKKWDRMRRHLDLDPCYQLYSLKDSGAIAIAKNIDSPLELKDQFRHSSLDTTSIYIRKAKPVANVNIMNMKEEW
jgi:integrase